MLLDARPVRDKKIEELKNRVNNLQEKPELALIRVGNDPASEKYVNNKIKMLARFKNVLTFFLFTQYYLNHIYQIT